MKTVAVIVAFAAIAVAPAVAGGEFKTGTEIKDGLQGWFGSDTVDTLIEDALAAGYVIGVHDALSGSLVCTPPDITQGEVIKQALTFLNSHEDRLTESADRLVAAALAERWACRQG
jgi:hypothetical protein